MFYDLIIVGGGPGGVAAGVYAARKRLRTLLVTDLFGGQSVVSADIQNWIGTKSVSGFDLGKMLEEHLRAQDGIDIVEGELVTEVCETASGLAVKTDGGKSFETKYLLVVSGSRRRKLNVPGEKEFDGKGVAYCATCDAPIFKGKTVAVVGGGNAGLEAALDLLQYAPKVYLLEYEALLKGDTSTQEKLRASPNVVVFTMAQVTEIFGREFVTGIRYKERSTGTVKELSLDGVFVEIGAVPNSEFIKGLVRTNEHGEIIVDHQTQKTSHPRIWAAGDVSDVRYKQNNISVGDSIKAALNISETAMAGGGCAHGAEPDQ